MSGRATAYPREAKGDTKGVIALLKRGKVYGSPCKDVVKTVSRTATVTLCEHSDPCTRLKSSSTSVRFGFGVRERSSSMVAEELRYFNSRWRKSNTCSNYLDLTHISDGLAPHGGAWHIVARGSLKAKAYIAQFGLEIISCRRLVSRY